MSFWSNASVSPKRKYNWLCEISQGKGGKLESWVIKKVTKPGWTSTEAVHRFLNYTFYYPGKVQWDEIQMTLVDPGGQKDTSEILYKTLLNSGWNMPRNLKKVTTVSKAAAKRAIGDIKIRQIDHAGTPVEEWTLKNAWIKSMKFGELNYEGDELMEIILALRYDWAELKIPKGASRVGVGTTSGQSIGAGAGESRIEL